jgi:hypothetical protein
MTETQPKKPRRKASDHVTIKDNVLVCLNCGDDYAMTLPAPMGMFAAMLKSFAKEHAKCKPSERGAARMKATTPDEWMASCDTGTSSETIWSVMTGRPVKRTGIPWDPADFGRCYRLLKLFPAWRARMPEVAKKHAEWAGLVKEWDELTRLFEEESPSGTCPKLWVRMQELRGEATPTTGTRVTFSMGDAGR